MNRIYQGRVTKVEVPDGKDEKGNIKWKKLENWSDILWQHHMLFQDAVNYYTLALAAISGSAVGSDEKSIILREWAVQVQNIWEKAKKKATVFEGPQKRLTSILGLEQNASFDIAAKHILRTSEAKPEQRASALIRLLEEIDKKNHNVVCGERLPFFCPRNIQSKRSPTSKAVSSVQEQKRQEEVRRFHNMQPEEVVKNAVTLDISLFKSSPKIVFLEDPKKARAELLKQFDNACKKHKELVGIKKAFTESIDKHGSSLKVPAPGSKPSGLYPSAIVFKYFPVDITKTVFLKATEKLAMGKDREVTNDPIADARVNDKPHFDYFTNIALIREKEKNRAAWFEFDLAAFIEAIMSPHRFYQDTQKRKEAARKLEEKIKAIEGKGGQFKESDSEDDDVDSLPGFEGDTRIDLLRKLVTDTLGWLGESETPDNNEGKKTEYSISERTLRIFPDIQKQWSELAEKGETTEGKLLEVLKHEQTEHQSDFGSATLYQHLAKPEFHPIWLKSGTEEWHAENPLKAWLNYKELQYELTDKKRPIHFTPAHPVYSPRYFDFPKKSETEEKEVSKNTHSLTTSLASEHIKNSLQFTAGLIRKTNVGKKAIKARFSYSAPRLRRDCLRSENNENLYKAPWLQPMMRALGIDEEKADRQNFANTRITLMAKGLDDIQLGFPVEANSQELQKEVSNGISWKGQFNWGGIASLSALRWPHEKKPKNPPEQPWWGIDSFSCLAVDLGQRYAGAFARLDVSTIEKKGKSRFIGEACDKKWYAKVSRMGLLRLPGEDVKVWRDASKIDKENGFAFRKELFGEKGRSATPLEAEETAELIKLFGANEKDVMPDNWSKELSFPEQNDKLLIVARRAQAAVSRLHRWAWFFDEAKRSDDAIREILESDDTDLKQKVNKNEIEKVKETIISLLKVKQELLPTLLTRLANRVLPLRGRSWEWKKHHQKNDGFILDQTGKAMPNVLIRGQRGLSMDRIEQITELRKRFQALNQSLRRQIGKKAPAKRDDSIPDCCPDLLEKLDHMKEQRVNQTAHMILAEALGLKLAEPPKDKKELNETCDMHGAYAKVDNPVSFIVIEDLSRYRSSQGRSPRENSRLMKWCHRAVRDKLKEMCEVFFPLCERRKAGSAWVSLPPLLETPAAYSSRFCSRSGVAGFRAVEVSPGFELKYPWSWLKDKKDKAGNLAKEALNIRTVSEQLKAFNQDKPEKPRTLLVPIAGGPIFVPISEVGLSSFGLKPQVVQADINAAINLGLRAISDPRIWEIHPRLRTEKRDGRLFAREKRKYGEEKVEVQPSKNEKAKKVKDDRKPNYFADFSGKVDWGFGNIKNESGLTLVSGKALWWTINQLQWERCFDINKRHIEDWSNKQKQ